MQLENCEVSPVARSVAVAPTASPRAIDPGTVTSNDAFPEPLVVMAAEPMNVRPSVRPLGSHAGLSYSSIWKLWLGVLCREPVTWVPVPLGAAVDSAGAF